MASSSSLTIRTSTGYFPLKLLCITGLFNNGPIISISWGKREEKERERERRDGGREKERREGGFIKYFYDMYMYICTCMCDINDA